MKKRAARTASTTWGVFVAILFATASLAMAADKPIGDPGIVLRMQTAFNPNLPGAGEAVRTFSKALKRMAGGTLDLKFVEPGGIAPTHDMLDAFFSGDLEAAFTWAGYSDIP